MTDRMKINKVAVLGSGVMGAQIAAHFANAGVHVLVFDLDQKIVDEGIAKSLKLKPDPYYDRDVVNKITTLNYSAHLERLGECDWIIEAIAEKLELKVDLYNRIIPHIKKNTILTSNTSGISISQLIKEMDKEISKRFFITHFFNPPRYMKLVEIVSSNITDLNHLKFLKDFIENKLGKGTVDAKDTPNFIANRIGVYGMMLTINEALNSNISIEDVDAVTGTLIGRPKSATFRTADIVGLDTMTYVAKTAYDKCVDDSERDIFKNPKFLDRMIKNGWLGQKTKQGFYKKSDEGIIQSIDFDTLEYKNVNKKRYESIRVARENIKFEDRIKVLAYFDDKISSFFWSIISKTLLYTSHCADSISDNIVSIDRAMRWGFGWELGPFEIWDIIGLEKSVKKMKTSGIKLPSWIDKMLESSNFSFYKIINKNTHYWCFKKNRYKPILQDDKNLTFNFYKKQNNLINKHWSASMIDLDDGILGVELHSVLKAELNPIDGSIIETLMNSLNWVKDNKYKGIVISGDGINFSAGANLNLILNAICKKDWDGIDMLIKSMQNALQNLRFIDFPIVSAPYGLVLGGGYETIGATDKIIAAAESYIGLVEVGVGLIPGAGGNLRMISNLTNKIKSIVPGSFSICQNAFETIGFAKVATSSNRAMKMGYLREHDRIVINRMHLLSEAKKEVISMSLDYKPPKNEMFKLPGSSGRLVLEGTLKGFVKSGKISEHDAKIGKKLAYVLTGGSKGGPFSPVDEKYLLDIEREAFLSLCGEQKTKERIEYMLRNGKPLRN
tara:strand:- start:6466 stop:8817 length:2352 start_codon:yes stop_codon:yes gene_type:complete